MTALEMGLRRTHEIQPVRERQENDGHVELGYAREERSGKCLQIQLGAQAGLSCQGPKLETTTMSPMKTTCALLAKK